MGWIGFDLDATMALWGWETHPVTKFPIYDVTCIGPPILPIIARMKALITEGQDVRVFTARVGPATDDECLNALERVTEAQAAAVGMPPFIKAVMAPQAYWEDYQRNLIDQFCLEHIGVKLPITATKDFHMYQLYDDRCIQVVSNTGELLQELYAQLKGAQVAAQVGEALQQVEEV